MRRGVYRFNTTEFDTLITDPKTMVSYEFEKPIPSQEINPVQEIKEEKTKELEDKMKTPAPKSPIEQYEIKLNPPLPTPAPQQFESTALFTEGDLFPAIVVGALGIFSGMYLYKNLINPNVEYE